MSKIKPITDPDDLLHAIRRGGYGHNMKWEDARELLRVSLSAAAQSAPSQPTPTRIVAAAIRWNGVVYTGPHHHNIIHQTAFTTGKKPVCGEQGFIADNGQFLDRVEARKVAASAGQIVQPLPHATDELFSEELWTYRGLPQPTPTDAELLDYVEKNIEEIFRDRAEDANGGWFCVIETHPPSKDRPLGEYQCVSGENLRAAIRAALLRNANPPAP